MAVVSPEVGDTHTVTFRLLAPNAKDVSVNGEFTRKAMTGPKARSVASSINTPALA